MSRADFAPTGLSGECDHCHRAPVRLYELEDDEPGDWTYCATCARQLAARGRRARRKAPTM